MCDKQRREIALPFASRGGELKLGECHLHIASGRDLQCLMRLQAIRPEAMEVRKVYRDELKLQTRTGIFGQLWLRCARLCDLSNTQCAGAAKHDDIK